jgi:hypothetical protein
MHGMQDRSESCMGRMHVRFFTLQLFHWKQATLLGKAVPSCLLWGLWEAAVCRVHSNLWLPDVCTSPVDNAGFSCTVSVICVVAPVRTAYQTSSQRANSSITLPNNFLSVRRSFPVASRRREFTVLFPGIQAQNSVNIMESACILVPVISNIWYIDRDLFLTPTSACRGALKLVKLTVLVVKLRVIN